MSFILDALRKTESRRQAGQAAPRIGDDHDTPPAQRRSSRRWLMAGFALFMLVGVAIGSLLWFGLPDSNGARHTVETSPPPTAPPVQEPDAIAQAEESPGTSIDEQALSDMQRAMAAQEAATEAPTPERDRRRQRTTPADRTVVREEPLPERERIMAQDEAMAEIERQIAQARRPEPEPAPEAPDPEPRAMAEATPAEPEPRESADWRPEAAEYVRAWELPFQVRRDLPELKLTIHVFSPQEDARFVLINGERYVPGDRITASTRLVDIRREGAIVDFRDHRFLLEP